MSTPRWQHSIVAAAAALAACSHGETSPVPTGLRVILTTAIEWPSTSEVAGRASRLAGIAVLNVFEDGPRRYLMTLDCRTEPTCREAIARIAADRTFALGIERDTKQMLPSRPGGVSSR